MFIAYVTLCFQCLKISFFEFSSKKYYQQQAGWKMIFPVLSVIGADIEVYLKLMLVLY